MSNYAVKRILVHNGSNFIYSIRELDLLVLGIQHPFIIKLAYVFFESPFTSALSPTPDRQRQDDVWFAMEKARGDLFHIYSNTAYRSMIRRNILKLFTHLMLALEFFTDFNIIHRDLKPENLLIFWDNDVNGNPVEDTLCLKVTDFGMSKQHEENVRSSTVIMTTLYRAPEVVMGCPYYNGSIDIWSAGAILFYLITGGQELIGECHSDNNTIAAKHINSILPLSEQTYPQSTNNVRFPKMRVNRTSPAQKIMNYYRAHPQLWPPNLDPNATSDLIARMNILDINRPHPRDILAHAWFQPCYQYISDIRATVPHNYAETRFITSTIPERIDAYNVLVHRIFNVKDQIPWYTHRVLFLAADLIDRCLALKGIPDQPPFPNEYGPKEFEKNYIYRLHLMVCSCIYIAIKYFHSQPPSIIAIIDLIFTPDDPNTYPPPNEIYADTPWINYLAQLEIYLLRDVFGFAIYRPNIYEVATKRDHKSVANLLREIYKMPQHYIGKSPTQIVAEIEAGPSFTRDPTKTGSHTTE